MKQMRGTNQANRKKKPTKIERAAGALMRKLNATIHIYI